jgi:hypothetical protein
MTDVIVTIDQLLGVPASGLSVDALQRLDASPQLGAARHALTLVPSEMRKRLAASVGAALHSALKVSLADVLAAGWAARTKLLEYADPSRHSPTEVAEVPLYEHEIRSSHGPTVELVFEGKRVFEVAFTISVALVIESALLRIQDGKIIAATAGRCSGKGSLSCGETILVERTTDKFSLPAELVFAPGVPIGTLVASHLPVAAPPSTSAHTAP